MEVKEVGSMLVCGIKVRTSMSKITEHVGVKPEALMKELAAQEIAPVGPQVWCYTGCDGTSAEAEFDLLIAIPVSKEGKEQNGFVFETLPSYRNVSVIHKGPWSELAAAYEQLVSNIANAGLTLVGTSREIYLNCDFENQQNCVTEIQMEVA